MKIYLNIERPKIKNPFLEGFSHLTECPAG